MTHLKNEDIEKLARLSHLELSADDIKNLPATLTESVNYVSNLSDLDTSDVPPTFFTTDAANVMEEDKVDESVMLSVEDALKNAPARKGNYFVVKRIL